MLKTVEEIIGILYKNKSTLSNQIEKICIKVHPSENYLDYGFLLKKFPCLEISYGMSEISELLDQTLVYCTFTSQTSLLAINKGIPVINLLFPQLVLENSILEELRFFETKKVQNLEEFEITIKDIFKTMVHNEKINSKNHLRGIENIRNFLINNT